MTRYEYALFSNPASGDDGVTFSHAQPPTNVQEFSQALGKGLKAEKSNPFWLHVNVGHTNMAAIAGQLGQRGWRMVGFTALTGGHMYMAFERELVSGGQP